MHTGIVQRIFNDHFDTYRRNTVLHSREKDAARSIMTCRTLVQGYHTDACPNDDYQVSVFNTCKHRACPQCGATDTQLWLERRKAQVLDCPYFHVIFTISHDLHIIWRYNRKLFTSLMMQAAWHSLLINQRDLQTIGNAVSYIDKITEESIPTLPVGTCIFSGIATPMPLKLKINELLDKEKPDSHTLPFEKITGGTQ